MKAALTFQHLADMQLSLFLAEIAFGHYGLLFSWSIRSKAFWITVVEVDLSPKKSLCLGLEWVVPGALGVWRRGI